MFFQSLWSLWWIFGCFAASVNDVDYDTNCAENYDNEISQDQQEDSPSAGPCRDDSPRWDKLFIALEDSHMRQNRLLSSVEQNCGGGVKMLWDKVTKGGCHMCAANMEKICKTQSEQTDSKIHQDLMDIMNFNIDLERNLNLTLQHILRKSHVTNERLKRLEDCPKMSPHPTLVTKAHGTSVLDSGLKEQEVENPLIATTLVTIATELQRIQLQLNEVIEETRRKNT
ncbi:unnamed protein product [Knipowitschia caucasica]